MNMNFSAKGGVVVYDDFHIDPKIPLDMQVNNLKEDMLQIEFEGGCILDVGWYPSFDLSGEFNIVLIKNFDWERPKYFAKAKSVTGLWEKIIFIMENKI